MPRPSVREQLVSSGLETLHAQGFNGCSIQEITDAAGVPKGSFFNHFKNKEALAAEILLDYAKGTVDRTIFTDPQLPAIDRLEKLFAGLNKYFSQSYDGCLIGKFMAEVTDETPQIRESLTKAINGWDVEIS